MENQKPLGEYTLDELRNVYQNEAENEAIAEKERTIILSRRNKKIVGEMIAKKEREEKDKKTKEEVAKKDSKK